MAISQSTITEVRARADIVAVIGARMTLKKAGSNYVGLCPFHGEKSPSFSVTYAKQFFHCFGCGKNGDVIQFLMDHDGMTFNEAVKDLAQSHGVKFEEDTDPKYAQRTQEQRQQSTILEDMCSKAAELYQAEFMNSTGARFYTNGRGLTQETIETYGIGYAPSSRKFLSQHLPDYSASQNVLLSGLVIDGEEDQGRYDRFRDRLMFPIRDTRGRYIGFGGRVLHPEHIPKYLNSPETPIFHKGSVLYGLHEARAGIMREKKAFVTEGYMDVVMMAQYGIPNAVAAMGTAMTEDHLRLLLRFTSQICFIFDGDKAGKAAAWKSMKVVLPILGPQHHFTFMTLPDAQDPDEYLRACGKEAFISLTKSAPTLSQYMLSSLVSQYGNDGKLDSAEAKTQFSVAIEALCADIPADNPIKELILQEADSLVGRQPRQAAPPVPAPSTAASRLRAHSARAAQSPFQRDDVPAGGAQAPKRPWLPLDEWKKTVAGQSGQRPSSPGNSGNPGMARDFNRPWSSTPAPIAPYVEKKTLWQRLDEAVRIVPEQANQLAPGIIALLDPESEAERPLIETLNNCEDFLFGPVTHAPDQVQGALDLLAGAQGIIAKLRTQEVKEELKKMRDNGEITEDAYVAQVIGLSG